MSHFSSTSACFLNGSSSHFSEMASTAVSILVAEYVVVVAAAAAAGSLSLLLSSSF